jgi:hypothetical protein
MTDTTTPTPLLCAACETPIDPGLQLQIGTSDEYVCSPECAEAYRQADTLNHPQPLVEVLADYSETHLPATIEPEPVVPLGTFPHDAEWRGLCQMARIMAGSKLLGSSALSGRPEDVLLVLMTGRALGIDPMTALDQCYVVDSKVTISPKLRLALLHQSGKGRVRPAFVSADRCVGRVLDAAGDIIEEREFTMADVPSSLRGKNNWKQYPARMLWWRLAGYLLDDHFPEIGLGLYSPDEIGAVTDEDGVPVDPSTVGLPPGYGDEVVEQTYVQTVAVSGRQDAIAKQVMQLAADSLTKPILVEEWARAELPKLAAGPMSDDELDVADDVIELVQQLAARNEAPFDDEGTEDYDRL